MSLFSNHSVFLFFLGEKQARIAQLISSHGGSIVNVLNASVTLVVTLETKLPFASTFSNVLSASTTTLPSSLPLLYQLKRAEAMRNPVVIDAWIEAAIAQNEWLPYGDFLCAVSSVQESSESLRVEFSSLVDLLSPLERTAMVESVYAFSIRAYSKDARTDLLLPRLSVFIRDESGTVVFTRKEHTSPQSMAVSYAPTTEGKHCVDVLSQSGYRLGRFEFLSKAPEVARLCFHNQTRNLTAGRKNRSLQVELRGENFLLEDLTLVAWDEANSDVPIEIVKSERGAFTIQLMPLDSGLIVISPLVKSQALPQLKILVKPAEQGYFKMRPPHAAVHANRNCVIPFATNFTYREIKEMVKISIYAGELIYPLAISLDSTLSFIPTSHEPVSIVLSVADGPIERLELSVRPEKEKDSTDSEVSVDSPPQSGVVTDAQPSPETMQRRRGDSSTKELVRVFSSKPTCKDSGGDSPLSSSQGSPSGGARMSQLIQDKSSELARATSSSRAPRAFLDSDEGRRLFGTTTNAKPMTSDESNRSQGEESEGRLEKSDSVAVRISAYNKAATNRHVIELRPHVVTRKTHAGFALIQEIVDNVEREKERLAQEKLLRVCRQRERIVQEAMRIEKLISAANAGTEEQQDTQIRAHVQDFGAKLLARLRRLVEAEVGADERVEGVVQRHVRELERVLRERLQNRVTEAKLRQPASQQQERENKIAGASETESVLLENGEWDDLLLSNNDETKESSANIGDLHDEMQYLQKYQRGAILKLNLSENFVQKTAEAKRGEESKIDDIQKIHRMNYVHVRVCDFRGNDVSELCDIAIISQPPRLKSAEHQRVARTKALPEVSSGDASEAGVGGFQIQFETAIVGRYHVSAFSEMHAYQEHFLFEVIDAELSEGAVVAKEKQLAKEPSGKRQFQKRQIRRSLTGEEDKQPISLEEQAKKLKSELRRQLELTSSTSIGEKEVRKVSSKRDVQNDSSASSDTLNLARTTSEENFSEHEDLSALPNWKTRNSVENEEALRRLSLERIARGGSASSSVRMRESARLVRREHFRTPNAISDKELKDAIDTEDEEPPSPSLSPKVTGPVVVKYFRLISKPNDQVMLNCRGGNSSSSHVLPVQYCFETNMKDREVSKLVSIRVSTMSEGGKEKLVPHQFGFQMFLSLNIAQYKLEFLPHALEFARIRVSVLFELVSVEGFPHTLSMALPPNVVMERHPLHKLDFHAPLTNLDEGNAASTTSSSTTTAPCAQSFQFRLAACNVEISLIDVVIRDASGGVHEPHEIVCLSSDPNSPLTADMHVPLATAYQHTEIGTGDLSPRSNGNVLDIPREIMEASADKTGSASHESSAMKFLRFGSRKTQLDKSPAKSGSRPLRRQSTPEKREVRSGDTEHQHSQPSSTSQPSSPSKSKSIVKRLSSKREKGEVSSPHSVSPNDNRASSIDRRATIDGSVLDHVYERDNARETQMARQQQSSSKSRSISPKSTSILSWNTSSSNNSNSKISPTSTNASTQQSTTQNRKPTAENVMLLLSNLQSQLDCILAEEQANNPHASEDSPRKSPNASVIANISSSNETPIDAKNESNDEEQAVPDEKRLIEEAPSQQQISSVNNATSAHNNATNDTNSSSQPNRTVSTRPERRLSKRRADKDLTLKLGDLSEGATGESNKRASPNGGENLNTHSTPFNKTQALRPGSLKAFHRGDKEPSTHGESLRTTYANLNETKLRQMVRAESADRVPDSPPNDSLLSPGRTRSKSSSQLVTPRDSTTMTNNEASHVTSLGGVREVIGIDGARVNAVASSSSSSSATSGEKERSTKDTLLRAISGKRHTSHVHHSHNTCNDQGAVSPSEKSGSRPNSPRSRPIQTASSSQHSSATSNALPITGSGATLDLSGYQHLRVTFVPPAPGQYFVFVTFLDPATLARYLVHGSPIYLLVEDHETRDSTRANRDEMQDSQQSTRALNLSVPGLKLATVFHSVPFNCVLEANMSANSPALLLDSLYDVSLVQSDGATVHASLLYKTEKVASVLYYYQVTPLCVGEAVLQVLPKSWSDNERDHPMPSLPSPIRLNCLSQPTAYLEPHAATIPVRQQYLFKLVTSLNLNEELLDVSVTDTNNGSQLKYEILSGRGADETSDKEWRENYKPCVTQNHYDIYWSCDVQTVVSVSVKLSGQQEVSGSPFRVTVLEEDEVFQSAISYSAFALQCNNRIFIDQDVGLRLTAYWQSKNFHIPLVWSVCVINDSGDIIETMLPHHGLSRTGAIEVIRNSTEDYHASLFLRPNSLRDDARCVVLVLSCLQENLSELKKLVFRVSNGSSKWEKVSFSPDVTSDANHTSFLLGLVARTKSDLSWAFDLSGHYAAGRIITDFLPNLKSQINRYNVLKALNLPFQLERAEPLPVHPKIAQLDIQTRFYSAKTDQKAQSLSSVLYFYDEKNNNKLILKQGEKRHFAACEGIVRIKLDKLPKCAKSILVFACTSGDSSFQNYNSLHSEILAIESSQIETRKMSLQMSLAHLHQQHYERAYRFATYKSKLNREPGSALAIGKLFRRSRESPWEYVAIGLPAKSLPHPHDEFVTLLLQDHWQPLPQHLAVIAINGNNIPPVIETQFKMYSKSFLTIAPLKSEKDATTPDNLPANALPPNVFRTAAVTGVYPFWGETFRCYDVCQTGKRGADEKTAASHAMLVTCWSEGAEPTDPLIYIGEFEVNLKKFFKESESNGCTVVEKSFSLQIGKGKKSAQVKQDKSQKKGQPEVRLRFIAY